MRRGIGRLRARTSGPGYDPATLFSGGEQGGLYDPSDLSSMWQDSAGTTPAVVDQPVGKINDKSGRNNHATQATGSSRPILRNSGALYWLEFDGLDDWLTSTSFALAATSVMCASVRILNAAASIGNIYDSADGLNRQLIGPTSANAYRMFAGGTVSGGARDALDHVIVANFAGASSVLEVDKAAIASGSASTSVIATGITIGCDGSARTQLLNGRFYGGIVLARALTAGEKTSVNTYLGGKAGLSL